MKAFIQNVRSQPHHVRHLATILSTMVVAVVVLVVWFNSFQHDIYSLLNPTQAPQAQDQMFAQQSKSLFGSIFQAIADSKAQIVNFISGKGNQTDVMNTQQATETDTTAPAAHPLPVNSNK